MLGIGICNGQGAHRSEASNASDAVVHVNWFPQPFGRQAQWTVGKGLQLDLDPRAIRTQALRGGYVQSMYKLSGSCGKLMPYLKWQSYRGASRFDTSTPKRTVFEIELGIEWQANQARELLLSYDKMRRTDASKAPNPLIRGDLVRIQLQINYWLFSTGPDDGACRGL